MKKIFTFIQIFLLPYTVFGADADEGKAVSVMEGDSVTLIPNQDVQGIILVQWRFGGPTIAQISGKRISYPEYTKIFTDRLKLNETGSLTIINMRHKHSGRYELVIDHSEGKLEMNFDVTISEPPFVFEAFKAERKSLTVTEGDPVILHTDITKLQGHELIVWRFGDEGKLLAKEDKETKSSPYYNTDERFKGRLQLNDQTGSLTINNMKDTDAGLYTVKINSNEQTTYKRFIVIVIGSGLSSGVVAAIVVVGLLLFGVAAGLGIRYHRRKISELQGKVYLTAVEGDVTVKNETKLHKNDEIQWWFGNESSPIAGIKDGEIYTSDGRACKFKDKLKLDMTGSLTIKKIRRDLVGEYTLEIRRRGKTTERTFFVLIKVKRIQAEEGEPVTLMHDTEIQTDDEVQWLFGDKNQLIAKMTGKTREITYPYEKFSDGLKLDKKTGYLTIKKITIEHCRFFKVKISSSRRTDIQKFTIYFPMEKKTFTKGDTAVLPNAAEIQREDQIEWRFKGKKCPIAEIKDGQIRFPSAGPGDIFKDTLNLDKKTGSLTIKNTTPEHSGRYCLHIKNSTGATIRAFNIDFSSPKGNQKKSLAPEMSQLLHKDGQDAVNENERLSPV